MTLKEQWRDEKAGAFNDDGKLEMSWDEIADWWLAEIEKVVEEIEKLKKDYENEYDKAEKGGDYPYRTYCGLKIGALEEALALLTKIKE